MNKFSYIPAICNMPLKSRMHKFTTIFLLLAAIGFFTPGAGMAQESEGSLLPEIDPQDIEIRSQFSARFPGLRRQPILGFRPGSRVFQSDPERMPFMEEPEEIAAQLPIGELSRPDAPPYRPYPFATPHRLYASLGAGNYVTPEAELRLNHDLSDGRHLYGSMQHTSGNSHLDQKSSFRYLNLDGGYLGRLSDKTHFNATLGIASDFNYLIEPEQWGAFLGHPGRKSYLDLSTAFRIRRNRNSLEHLEAGLDLRYGSIGLDEEATGYSSDLSDWRVSGDIGWRWAGGKIHELFTIRAHARTGGWQMAGGETEMWHVAGATGAWEWLVGYATRLDLELGAVHVGDAAGESIVYLTPDFTMEHYLSDRITLSAHLKGQPHHARHYDHHQENRFLLPDNLLRHSYRLSAGGQLTLEPIPNNQIRVGFSYVSNKNHPYYHRSQHNLLGGAGHYVVEYADATIPRAHAGMSVDLVRERIWFDVEGYIQSPRISPDQKTPFEEEYGLGGTITVRPFDPLVVEGWGQFIGPRTTLEGTELDPYLFLGTRLELRLTERWGVYGKILNLLNQEYEIWQGFPERPFQIYAGVTLRL